MTDIDLTLRDVYAGWEDVATPDDLEIVLETYNTTHIMHASLREILRLYYYTSKERACNLGIGTGQTIEIEPHEGHIRLKKSPLDVVTTFENVRSEIESILSDVFDEKDKVSSESSRDEQLSYLHRHLVDQNENIDLQRLYEKLTGTN